jgi:hypothetical protein
MAATVTKISGPIVQPGKGVVYGFSIAFDTSFATGGEPIDLTSYLGYLYGGEVQGMDAIADATRRFDVVGPGRATALTSTNVVITAHHSSGSDAVDNPSDGEDLSGVGALIIEVWGKGAIPSSWA